MSDRCDLGFLDELLGTDPKAKARKQTKAAILDRLEISDIKGACKAYGVGEPAQYEVDSWTGDKTRRKVTREHWVELAYNDLKLDQLIAYCQKKRIGIDDLTSGLNPAAAPVVAPAPRALPSLAAGTPPPHPSASTTATKPAAPLPRAEAAPRPVNRPPPEAPSLLDRVIHEIQGFKPSRRHNKEIGYHNELTGWLRGRGFGDSLVEATRGHSRPDITIGRDIAIEIKGPTKQADLNTLLTKCDKYLTDHKHMVIVLFDVQVSEAMLREATARVLKFFPQVRIIEK